MGVFISEGLGENWDGVDGWWECLPFSTFATSDGFLEHKRTRLLCNSLIRVRLEWNNIFMVNLMEEIAMI